jgi:thioredoxin reductase (NADPH)
VTQNTPLETDALIVGAGPAGLFQVFQLGLLEIQAHVVDALPHAGGQCVELYADKPIYDIPSVPVCTGRELTHNLLGQIAPFQPQFHFGQVVSEVTRQDDGRFMVRTDKGKQFLAKTLFIAGGVGAFQPKTLKVDGLDAFDGTQLAHHVSDAAEYENQHVVIVGDNDTALDWALRLCAGHPDGFPHKAQSVTLVHRRDAFVAESDTVVRFRALVALGKLSFVAGQITGLEVAADRLGAVQVTLPDASTLSLPLDKLLVLQGLSPKLGPIAQWGLAMERRQLVVNTESYATSEPGIFAVGDINTYPGKKKLILCAFHECVLAAFGAAHYLHPDRKVLLEYTTTSSRLHKVLGLA